MKIQLMFQESTCSSISTHRSREMFTATFVVWSVSA